jgi:predicted nucleic acid-binding protein
VTMILADTSVWVRHFRRTDPVLQSLVSTDRVLCHPLILVELASGTPPAPRGRTLRDLDELQRPVLATTDETLELIETERLYDTGCGAIDVMLLASTLLTPDTLLWTDDRALNALAIRLGVAFSPVRH